MSMRRQFVGGVILKTCGAQNIKQQQYIAVWTLLMNSIKTMYTAVEWIREDGEIGMQYDGGKMK